VRAIEPAKPQPEVEPAQIAVAKPEITNKPTAVTKTDAASKKGVALKLAEEASTTPEKTSVDRKKSTGKDAKTVDAKSVDAKLVDAKAAGTKGSKADAKLADTKKADGKKVDPKKVDKKAPPAHPSRIWVQVGVGRDEAAIAYDWRKFAKQDPALFKGRQPYVSDMGRTNRILAGPFETQKAASDLLTKLKKADFTGAFVWTSSAGQVVDPLAGK
jgi:hypothetical protein